MRKREREGKREGQKAGEKKERSHQQRFARSIKLLDLEMFSGGAHFLRLRVVNGA